MKVAIMQPTYLPWVGYFDLIDTADLFVFLDNVQFAKRSWQQRNRLKTPKGLEWLTVPVTVAGSYHQTIVEAKIAEADFGKKHLRTIELNYKRARYFERYFPALTEIYESFGAAESSLAALNQRLIVWLCESLGIAERFVSASALGIEGTKSGLLAEICRAVKADEYLSVMGSFDYLSQAEEYAEFSSRDISVFFHNYEHPEYSQLYSPFAPFASAIDILFNEGEQAIEIIRSGRKQLLSYDEVTALAQTA